MMLNLQSYPATAWMKDCDILGGQNILWPFYIFSGGQDPQLGGPDPNAPMIYAPVS